MGWWRCGSIRWTIALSPRTPTDCGPSTLCPPTKRSRAGLGDDGKGFGGLNAFGVHPDGQIVAVGSNDGNVRIWDIRSNQIGYALGHQTEAKLENERRGRRR